MFILFVTYNQSESLLAATYLQNYKYDVEVVDDGIEAINIIESKGKLPAVLFAHDILPNMDGRELYYVFQQKFPTARTKWMLAVTKPSDGEPWRDWSENIDCYIMRPYLAWQIVFSVEQLLKREVRNKAD